MLNMHYVDHKATGGEHTFSGKGELMTACQSKGMWCVMTSSKR